MKYLAVMASDGGPRTAPVGQVFKEDGGPIWEERCVPSHIYSLLDNETDKKGERQCIKITVDHCLWLKLSDPVIHKCRYPHMAMSGSFSTAAYGSNAPGLGASYDAYNRPVRLDFPDFLVGSHSRQVCGV